MGTVLEDLSMQSETDWWTSTHILQATSSTQAKVTRSSVMLALTNDWSAEAYEIIKQHTHNKQTHTLWYCLTMLKLLMVYC